MASSSAYGTAPSDERKILISLGRSTGSYLIFSIFDSSSTRKALPASLAKTCPLSLDETGLLEEDTLPTVHSTHTIQYPSITGCRCLSPPARPPITIAFFPHSRRNLVHDRNSEYELSPKTSPLPEYTSYPWIPHQDTEIEGKGENH